MKSQNRTFFYYHITFWSIAYIGLSFFKFFDINDILVAYSAINLDESVLLLSIGVSLIAGVLQGFLLAVVDIIISMNKKENKSFLKFILSRTVAYIFVIFIVILISVIIRVLLMNNSHPETVNTIKDLALNRIIHVYLIYAFLMSFVASFLFQLFQNIGPHLFFAVLRGKYYNPMEEDRIFMFLDLKDSTTYAEKLGHILFSNLIQDCFFDLDSSVQKYSAQIDQYIGDEAIITWPIKNSKDDLNPIYLYYDYIEKIKSRENYYLNKYGMVPLFKAGINCGNVTVAEIGIRKRSIAYLGDVLNTAARIQGKCNEFDKSLLISGAYEQLTQKESNFSITYLDSMKLKGKEVETKIFYVEE